MTKVNLSDVQGNLLRGYRMHYVTHLVVRIGDVKAAEQFLGDAISGRPDHPQITTESQTQWDAAAKPSSCLNVGVTAAGLAAFDMDDKILRTFPPEFCDGPVKRAAKVGDVGESAPSNWHHGLGSSDESKSPHLMWSIHGVSADARDELVDELRSRWGASGAFEVSTVLKGQGLPDPHREGHLGDNVHFGYRDSISQPRFEVNGAMLGRPNGRPLTPVGALLLGYPETSFANVQWELPRLHPELSRNSCFNAFRILEQDVDAFEMFLETTAAEHGWNKEFVAAKLMGRWRNGSPLADLGHEPGESDGAVDWSPQSDPPDVDEAKINNWDYPDMALGREDLEGRPCPLGAHIRRANPRGARIVQRSANATRPIVRRGIPYGPPFDPAKRNDEKKRGLLGNFFCGSILSQYEAMMYDWMNLGLQDPRVTGTNDPIIGANEPATSRFDIRVTKDETVTLRGLPRFTQTRGCLYLWMPSIQGLKHQAGV